MRDTSAVTITGAAGGGRGHESALRDIGLDGRRFSSIARTSALDHLKWRFANALPEPDFK
jgi:hypothetical protein